MTVLATGSGQAFLQGNGVQTYFEFGFALDQDSVIEVYVDSILVDNYTVGATGITFDTPPALGAVIEIDRITSLDQQRRWWPFEDFYSEKTEAALDKLILLKQESQWRMLMNLSVIPDFDSDLLVCDRGDDADILLWNTDGSEAGVFVGEVTTLAAVEGAVTGKAEGYLWQQYDNLTGVPYTYSYPTIALAEASGDPWTESDLIYIQTLGIYMVYRAALAVNGHSGLQHYQPFGSGVLVRPSGVGTVYSSQPAGVDPDSWGWTDASDGVHGTDYDADVVSGKARLKNLTASGRYKWRAEASIPGAGQVLTMLVVDAAYAASADASFDCVQFGANAYRNASDNSAGVMRVYKPLSATNWTLYNGPSRIATSIPFGTPTRLWHYVYAEINKQVIWTDFMSEPVSLQAYNGGAAPTNAGNMSAVSVNQSNEFQCGYHVLAELTV